MLPGLARIQWSNRRPSDKDREPSTFTPDIELRGTDDWRQNDMDKRQESVGWDESWIQESMAGSHPFANDGSNKDLECGTLWRPHSYDVFEHF